jgi:hypothetical protein
MREQLLLAILLLALFVSHTFSQAKDAGRSDGNLYTKALGACVNKEAQDFGKISSGVDYDLKNRIC